MIHERDGAHGGAVGAGLVAAVRLWRPRRCPLQGPNLLLLMMMQMGHSAGASDCRGPLHCPNLLLLLMVGHSACATILVREYRSRASSVYFQASRVSATYP